MKIKQTLLHLIIFTVASATMLPKKGFSQSQKDKQDAALFVYNCGFGGITAGIGAVINKKKNEKVLKTFWRGFKYGSLGGTLNYCSKRIDYLISYSRDNNNVEHDAALLWAWPTKIVHSVGSSIIDNAAANKPNVFLDYNMPVEFINLSISFKNSFSIRPQLMPVSFSRFIVSVSQSENKLQAKETIMISRIL